MENQELINKIQKIEKEILDDIVKICDDAGIDYFLDGGTLLGAKRHQGYIPWDDDIDLGIHKDDWNDFESLIVNKLSDKYVIQSERGSVKIDSLRAPLKVNYRNSFTYDDNTDAYQNFPMQDQHIFVDVFRFTRLPESEKLTNFIWAILYGIAMFKEGRFLKLRSLIGEQFNSKYIEIAFTILYPFLYVLFNFLSIFEQKILDFYYIKGEHGSDIGFDISHWRNMKPVRIPSDLIYPVAKNEVTFENTKYSAPNQAENYLELRYGNWKELPPVEKRIFQHFVYVDFDDDNVLDKQSEMFE